MTQSPNLSQKLVIRNYRNAKLQDESEVYAILFSRKSPNNV